MEPREGRRVSEPIFVRSVEGHSDEEGWLLTVVDDPDRGASDLYVLDASSFGRRSPEAVIHLPERLPFRSHGNGCRPTAIAEEASPTLWPSAEHCLIAFVAFTPGHSQSEVHP